MKFYEIKKTKLVGSEELLVNIDNIDHIGIALDNDKKIYYISINKDMIVISKEEYDILKEIVTNNVGVM